MRRFLLLLAVLAAIPACARTPDTWAPRSAEGPSSPLPITVPAAGSVEVIFSPHGGGTDALVRFIGEARKSIRVAAYSFTSNPIGRALVEAKKRGVDVRVVLDRDHNGRRASSNSLASFVAAAGIPVRIDTAVRIFHNKFVCVDNVSVAQGSFNFSAAADTSNRENLLIHRNAPALAKAFLKHWEDSWAESTQTLQPGY